uniref:Caveolin n=2 Tax=Macrostomum lignano TaxID=282301 RepID=A0A1I8IKV9_9PLAT
MSGEQAAATAETKETVTTEQPKAEETAAAEAQAPSTSAETTEDAKKEKEEKEKAKKEKDEQKKREAEEKKRKREEEKKAKAEAKAKAKAEAAESAAAGGSSTARKPCWLTDNTDMDLLNRDKNQINCHVNRSVMSQTPSTPPQEAGQNAGGESAIMLSSETPADQSSTYLRAEGEIIGPAGTAGSESELQQQQSVDEATASSEGKPGTEKQRTGRIPPIRIPKAPKVAGRRVTLERNKDYKEQMDIVTRDPNSLNIHCKVQFEDIIAEPDPTVFSFDNVWTCSFKVFTSTKLWCYRIISLICAIPAAICWGIEFAMLSFCTIWCWQPSLKAFDISLWYTRRIYEILLKVFVEPCFHAFGKCLSHIVVTVRRE